MKKMMCLAAAVCLCGAAFAHGTWSTEKEATYRINCTLNGGERWDVEKAFSLLGGNEAYLYMKAINNASDKNGAMFNEGVAMTPGIYDWRSDKTNMMGGMDMYAMSYQDRCKKEISDWDAYKMLCDGVPGAEQGVIESTWPTLTEGTQHAILKVIKRSQFITPPTAAEMDWYK